MPANLKAPFSESCCDGGAYANANSCQPCGCDPGADWLCGFHKVKKLMADELERLQSAMDKETYGS